MKHTVSKHFCKPDWMNSSKNGVEYKTACMCDVHSESLKGENYDPESRQTKSGRLIIKAKPNTCLNKCAVNMCNLPATHFVYGLAVSSYELE